MKQLDVDENVASILVQEGFSSIEEVAYVPAAELAGIEEFDEDIIKELRNRARDVLLTQAIASEESLDAAMPTDDLLTLEGMSPDLALALARRGVRSREDLADQAVDDLADIEGLSAEEAGSLIMKAREPLVRGAATWLTSPLVNSPRHSRCRSTSCWRSLTRPASRGRRR